MAEIVKLEMTKAEAETLCALIADGIERMKAAQERMEQDQAEIMQLRAEIRAILERDWQETAYT
jgi:nitrogen-specific signal transduction histidine kinase